MGSKGGRRGGAFPAGIAIEAGGGGKLTFLSKSFGFNPLRYSRVFFHIALSINGATITVGVSI